MTNLILMLKINLQEYGISSLQFILDLMIRCWRQPREGRRRSVDHEKTPKRRLFLSRSFSSRIKKAGC